MANELSTAGIVVKYKVEASVGQRPSAFTSVIPNVKSISSLNPEPNMLEVTDLAETSYKRYINGLKDLGGAVTFTANLCNEFKTAWEALCSTAETAKGSGFATWFEISVPSMTDAFYFAGEPSPLGIGAIEVDSVLEIDAYVAPNKVDGWA